MRNFAIFLLFGNIVLWSWQLLFRRTELIVTKDIQHAGFVQAEKKLKMLGEASLEPQLELSGEAAPGQHQVSEIEARQDSQPAVITPSAVVAVANSASVPAPLEPWCGSTNSVGSQENAKKIRAEWLKIGGETEQELVKEPGSSIWWVYLSAVKDEDAAAQILRQLREKGIDSYYMRSGELAGGISLGVFSRKDSAVSVQEGIRKKGYAAEIKAIQRAETKFHIMLKLDDREKIHDQRVQELLGKYSSIQVKEIACK